MSLRVCISLSFFLSVSLSDGLPLKDAPFNKPTSEDRKKFPSRDLKKSGHF
jgi:hypothetical protein